MIRLERVREGHALKQKIMLKVGGFVMGVPPPDMLRVLFYRPDFWGRPVGLLTDNVLRGSSSWTVGERELFAAWVSLKNKCRFCSQAHSAVAAQALGPELVKLVMSDGEESDLGPKAKAMLPFLEKLALEPDEVKLDDLEHLRAEGIDDDSILDAIYIVMLFCMYNRVADALGCEEMAPKQLEKTAKMLLSKGYDL
jgi:uncharacterized peroxidase-related enzyme